MKLFKCDICGSEVKDQYVELHTLYEEYQVEGIKDVCTSCYNRIMDANKCIEKALHGLKGSWVQSIIHRLIKKEARHD